MIALHRLGHSEQEFHVNPDLIVTIEANPDTVITLANGSKLLIAEAPARVAAAVREYRVEVMAGALRARREIPSDDNASSSERLGSIPLRLAPQEAGR